MFDVIYQEPGGRRKRLDFEGVSCRIGSDKRNDFVIRSRQVAKKHAEISFDRDAGYLISDLGSKTGTWINKKRCDVHEKVSNQDEIVIADIKIWIRTHESERVKNTQKSAENPTLRLTVKDDADSIDRKNSAEQVHHWGNVIHEQLIAKMDLRRKDVHRMSDDELRIETETLIDEILIEIADTIPGDVNVDIVKQNVLSEAVGLGPLEKFLEDDSISEIMVNNYREVFVERDGKLERSEYGFSGDHAVMSVIERIITPLGRRIDESSPMVDARLKDGSRVNAIIPPLALKGPSLTIRKFAKKKLQFDDLIRFGSVDAAMVEFLRICVETRKNIIVSGGTGSGKTTLLNVLSNFIPDSERIVTVEDAAELKLDQPNLVSLESKPANVEGKGQISIRELVKNTLRMRPDRIVVGECRGGEALDMLQAMNTGHDGSLTTAHANSPRDLVSRLEVMVLMAGIELPVTAIREQISSAVNIIVQQTRYPCGTRKISRITEIVGIESGTVQLQDIFTYKRKGYGEDGKIKGEFMATGFIPTFYEELIEVGMDLDISIFQKIEDFGGAERERY